MAEVGELSNEIPITTCCGQKEFQPSAEWQGELGDVYFALLAVADKSGVDLHQALHDSLSKYGDRIAKAFAPYVHRSRDL